MSTIWCLDMLDPEDKIDPGFHTRNKKKESKRYLLEYRQIPTKGELPSHKVSPWKTWYGRYKTKAQAEQACTDLNKKEIAWAKTLAMWKSKNIFRYQYRVKK